MKRILAFFLILCTLCLFGCASDANGVTVEPTEKGAKLTLDNFMGETEIKIANPVGEGTMYFKTNITNGSVDMSYREGWRIISKNHHLLTVDAENNENSGVYVIGSREVAIILSSAEATSGEILFEFSQSSSPFK